jgi:hypothetical protein
MRSIDRFSCLFVLSIAAGCGGTTNDPQGPGSGPSSDDSSSGGSQNQAAAGGSGSITVMSDRPIQGSLSGAQYQREASFTPAMGGCPTTTLGACSVNPCRPTSSTGTPSAPLPNAGTVTIGGAEMTSATLEPQRTGSYTAYVVPEQVAWLTGGESVTLAWEHAPGDDSQGGGSITMFTPPYLALTGGSAFDAAPTTIARNEDLTVAWTSDSSPSVLDQVLVDIWTGSTQLTCQYVASAGIGVVPAEALQHLTAGPGNFDIHSKEYASKTVTGVDGSSWSYGFNVDAHARASYGLTYGAVTVQ